MELEILLDKFKSVDFAKFPKYFVAEGAAAAGKDTIQGILHSFYSHNHQKLHTVAEPSKMGVWNTIIREGLLKGKIPSGHTQLYFANRACDTLPEIKNAIKADYHVFSTRNFFSTLVYQVKLSGESKKNVEKTCKFFYESSLLPVPELGIIIDISPKVSYLRRNKQINEESDIFEGDINKTKKQVEGYRNIILDYPDIFKNMPLILIDGGTNIYDNIESKLDVASNYIQTLVQYDKDKINYGFVQGPNGFLCLDQEQAKSLTDKFNKDGNLKIF